MISNNNVFIHSSNGRIAPLMTVNPVTGATRFVTSDLVREAYLAPAPIDWDLATPLEGRNAPWTESLSTAREETTRAVEAGLTSVARATKYLDPDEIDVSSLVEGRAKVHLMALKHLWHDLDRLPEPLATWSHVITDRRFDGDGTDQLIDIELLDFDTELPLFGFWSSPSLVDEYPCLS
ncbi:MAG: hypothetical protein GY952_07110 [Rhodobacteraceae bacterium]|nr:hypothetical protein [Paracoccaceae bacterium]